MAYYPIKCPYCLMELSNSDVRFNLRTGIAGKPRKIRDEEPFMSARGGGSYGGAPGGDEYDSAGRWMDGAYDGDGDPFEGGGGWLADTAAPAENERRAAPSNTPAEGFYTYAELQRYFGEDNVRPILNTTVYAPPALANRPEYRDDLLVGVEIKTRGGGYETTTTYLRRYCECEKELMTASGIKASYVLLMLGPSSAGKTMYLIALHKALKVDGGYLLPPDGSGSRGVTKLLITVLSGGGSGDTSLSKMADDLFYEGKLPLSTFQLDNEPLVLDVSVDFRTGKSNNALLFLRDMPGEFLTNQEKTEELHKIAHQFPLFDGFIMMIDPFTFTERNVFRTDWSGETLDNFKLKYIEDLDEVLAKDVAPFTGGSKITRPTAVVVTKGDHFFDEQNRQRLEYKGVQRSFPTLTSWQKASFDKHYFREIDWDVARILNSLSPNISKMLEKNFSYTFFALASALSKEPIGIESRTVTEISNGIEARITRNFVVTPSAIKPWRVTDSFIRMLMRLNIVPPFDEVEIRPPDMESREAALARNSRYLAAINAWGRTYCTAWEDIAGEAIDIPPAARGSGGKPKKGR